MVETDCANIICALRSKSDDRARWEEILKEIRAACTLLPEFKIQSIRREANKVAHTLAHQAMHTMEFVVKHLETPSCIRKLVCLYQEACMPGSQTRESFWTA
jgi:hypothetical protein